MNVRLLTVASDIKAEPLQWLKASLNKNNWEYNVIETLWHGFGTKLISVYNWLVINTDIDAIFFTDAYDVIVLGDMTEALSKINNHYGLDKIVCSSERGCWPVQDWEQYYYNRFEHGINYLNSGAYYAPRELFIKLFDNDPPQYETDDQMWMTKQFLFNDNINIVLDNNQVVFNSHSFINDGEYCYENNRIQILGNEPVIIHSNGRTKDPKLDELINKI